MFKSNPPPHSIFPLKLCPMLILSLRATETCLHAEVPAFVPQRGTTRRQAFRHAGVAISVFSMTREIASVVSLPRNDITTQSPGEEGVRGNSKYV